MSVSREQLAANYPISTYRYRVTVGKDEMAFSGVSGLEMGFETMEYKDGLGNWFQMPGQATALNISLKRGIFPRQTLLHEWLNSATHNQVQKKDISISLTDESGETPLVTWNIIDAFPTKLTAPSFDASSNEVAIEELSLLALRMMVRYHR